MNKHTNKLLISLSLVAISSAPLITTISGCSCSNTEHIVCDKTTRTTFDTSKFVFNLDKDYKTNEFQISVKSNDLNIVSYEIKDKQLIIKISPKNKPTIETKYNFQLEVVHKEWSKTFDLHLIYSFVDDQIKYHDDNGWQHAIEHIASCKHPTIFISKDASFYVQQALNMFMSASLLAISNGHTYLNDEYKYNDLIYIIPLMAWDYKNNKNKEGVTKFEYLYNTLVSSKYGFSDIIANSKAKKLNQIDLSLGNQMIVTNMQDFDLSLEDYDQNLPSYKIFNGYDWDVDFVNKIMDMYEAIDPDIKFNFVTNDYCWDNICQKKNENEAYAKLQLRILKKMDKFYLLSDGSYSWVTGTQLYKQYATTNDYSSSIKQEETLNKLRSVSEQEGLNLYKNINPYMFLNNQKYFTIFESSEQSVFSLSNLDNDLLTKDSTIKPCYPWSRLQSYKKIIDGDYYNNFMEGYLNFFQFYKQGHVQKFSDYVAYGTYSKYSSNKKNFIFLIPQKVVKSSQNPDENLFKILRNMLSKIRTIYPESEWNFFFSFHPRSEPDEIKRTLNVLFETSDPQYWPSNALIIDNHYPFEYLLSADQYLAENKGEPYHLINPNTFNETKPSGIMSGFDIGSTCYYGAISILAKEYGLGFDKAMNIIQKDAYYLPRSFLVPNGFEIDGKDYSQINKDNLYKSYGALHDVHEFIDLESFEYIE